MRTFDVAPLFRSSVGFDRLFDLIDQASRPEQTASWPPYNIEKVGDDRYAISLAVAGFSPDEIELVQHDTTLLVAGRGKDAESERHYLHRGIAARSFRQSFSLADHVKVVNARLDNGLLTVELVREVPEALKPRRIAIGGDGGGNIALSRGQDNAPAQVEDRARAA